LPSLAVTSLSAVEDSGELYDSMVSLPAGDERLGFAQKIVGLGIPAAEIAVIRTDRGAVADLAGPAVAALGQPDRAEKMILVQSGHDQDHATEPLPRTVQEMTWPVSEDFGVTHLEGRGGFAVFGLLEWLLTTGEQSIVVIADRPEITCHGPVTPSGAVLALRVRADDGPLRILEWGEGGYRGDDRVISGDGPLEPWLLFCREAAAGLAPGRRLVLQTGRRAGPQAWLLVEVADPDALTVRLGDHRG
jgi:hypothetical protein